MLKPFILLLALASASAFGQFEVKELATRPDVTLRFVYARAADPIASAVLFQGGGGNIGIFPNGSVRVENFLSGGARRFTENGITVAIVDVPSAAKHSARLGHRYQQRLPVRRHGRRAAQG